MLGILFNVEAHTINYHIKKIFNDSELLEISTTRKFRIVQNVDVNINVTERKIIEILINDPTLTTEKISMKIHALKFL